jgi:hypothetical protein
MFVAFAREAQAARLSLSMTKPVAKAKPKRAPVKKNAQPAPAVEAVGVEAIEQPTPAQ